MRDQHGPSLTKNFTIRAKQELSEVFGAPTLVTKEFEGVHASELLEIIDGGGKVKIDLECDKVRVKRGVSEVHATNQKQENDCQNVSDNGTTEGVSTNSDANCESNDAERRKFDKSPTWYYESHSDGTTEGVSPDDEDHLECNYTLKRKYDESRRTLESLLPDILNEVSSMGDGYVDDFLSLMKAISKGHLNDNIGFHLYSLDMGRFYGNESVQAMRYNEETMAFWTTIEKLFKGRGINFFRGYKARGLSSDAKPEDCRINWIVPSDKILKKYRDQIITDVNEPGLMQATLNTFADRNPGAHVKVSMDAKTMIYSNADNSEENFGGLEPSPTLDPQDVNSVVSLNVRTSIICIYCGDRRFLGGQVFTAGNGDKNCLLSYELQIQDFALVFLPKTRVWL